MEDARDWLTLVGTAVLVVMIWSYRGEVEDLQRRADSISAPPAISRGISNTQTVTNNIQTPDEKEEIRQRARDERRPGWYTIPEAEILYAPVSEREIYRRRKSGEYEERTDPRNGRILVRPRPDTD